MSLEDTQVIGGVSVRIGADLSGLKAGEADARRITSSVDRTSATVKITADTTALRTEIAKVASTPVAIKIDTAAASAQMMALKQQILAGTGATVLPNGSLQLGGLNSAGVGGGPPIVPPTDWMGNAYKTAGAILISRIASGALRGLNDTIEAGGSASEIAGSSVRGIDNALTGGLGQQLSRLMGRYNPGNALVLASRGLRSLLPNSLQRFVVDPQTTGEMLDSEEALRQQQEKTDKTEAYNRRRLAQFRKDAELGADLSFSLEAGRLSPASARALKAQRIASEYYEANFTGGRYATDQQKQNYAMLMRQAGIAGAAAEGDAGRDTFIATQRESAQRAALFQKEQDTRLAMAQDAINKQDAILARGRKIGTFNKQLIGAGNVAGLASSGRGDEAAQEQLLNSWQAALDNNPESRAAINQSFNQQFAALLQGQSDNTDLFNIGIGARIDSAGARGKGMGALASVIGVVAGMKAELVGAQEGQRPQIMDAQKAELESIRASFSRPSGFATEFDPNRDITGSPDGSGETVDLLKVIAGYLETIANKDGGATAQ